MCLCARVSLHVCQCAACARVCGCVSVCYVLLVHMSAHVSACCVHVRQCATCERAHMCRVHCTGMPVACCHPVHVCAHVCGPACSRTVPRRPPRAPPLLQVGRTRVAPLCRARQRGSAPSWGRTCRCPLGQALSPAPRAKPEALRGAQRGDAHPLLCLQHRGPVGSLLLFLQEQGGVSPRWPGRSLPPSRPPSRILSEEAGGVGAPLLGLALGTGPPFLGVAAQPGRGWQGPPEPSCPLPASEHSRPAASAEGRPDRPGPGPGPVREKLRPLALQAQ